MSGEAKAGREFGAQGCWPGEKPRRRAERRPLGGHAGH